MMDIHVLPIGKKYLLYSPLRRMAAFLNKSAIAHFYKFFVEKNNTDKSGSIGRLIDIFLRNNPIPPTQQNGGISPPFLGIIPSRSCNLQCAYCGFDSENESEGSMDIQLAVVAVDWMFEHCKKTGLQQAKIHFFGGEPFVSKEIVDVIIHRSRYLSEKSGIYPVFEASTNGVFDNIQAQFVGNYFDSIVLSFDGLKEQHNLHRSFKTGMGSFDFVVNTAHILSHLETKLCFRCCVSDKNVSSMTDIGEWFCTTFNPSIINFEPLKATAESRKAGISPPNPYEFSVQYERARQKIKNYGIGVIYAASEIGSPRHTFCPVGRDTLIISPNGRVSSCYLPQEEWKRKNMDLDVGWLKSNGEMNIEIDRINEIRQLVQKKPRCENCFCRWSCSGGCHVSNSWSGSSSTYNDFCIQTRIITTFKILESLGLKNEIEKLIESPEMMSQVALNASDRLKDYDGIQ